MKILMVTPEYRVNGQTRVVLEWGNRLISLGHDVIISQEYKNDNLPLNQDVLIITTPDAVRLLSLPYPAKKFIFCQMAYHLHDLKNKEWMSDCLSFYRAPYTMFSVSQWNMEIFKKEGRTAKTVYIGNGVNFDDFPIEITEKDNKTVLVSGKDPIAYGVAEKLSADGYHIIHFSDQRINSDFEFYHNPSLPLMNDLYKRATIMIKADMFTGRSLSPLEAFTKGTVTARAIHLGDDDLIHAENCLRVRYNEDELYKIAKYLLNNPKEREFYAYNGLEHIKNYNWDYWMDIVNQEIQL